MNTKTVPPYTIKTNGAVTIYLSGECHNVTTDHPNYKKVIDAIKAGDFSNIENLINVSKAVTSFGNGRVKVLNGQVFYGDFALHNTLTVRIIKMMNEGFNFQHMVRFLDNLMQNPSHRAVNETYTFLENYGLPITDDGCFLAYKAVRNDYKDIYSGKLDNRIGASPSMPRNMVDEAYERDCSTGLHVGALDYVTQYGHFTKGQAPSAGGNRLLIVKVNPKDVVSVPRYDGHPKMRVSTYTVVSEIKDVVKELDKVVYKSNAETLAPDAPVSKPATKSKVVSSTDIDTTSPWNETKYREGYTIGSQDSGDGLEYGFNRDYSEVNSYRIGYNDGYNNRPNQADSQVCCGTSCACDESDESDESDEYDDGYDLGAEDAINGLSYQTSLELADSEEFKRGYRAGFNDNNY